MSKKTKTVLKSSSDEMPGCCAAVIFYSMYTDKVSVEDDEEDLYDDYYETPVPKEARSPIEMAITAASQKEAAKGLKKLGFTSHLTVMGNHGERLTVWVRSRKDSKMRRTPVRSTK